MSRATSNDTVSDGDDAATGVEDATSVKLSVTELSQTVLFNVSLLSLIIMLFVILPPLKIRSEIKTELSVNTRILEPLVLPLTKMVRSSGPWIVNSPVADNSNP